MNRILIELRTERELVADATGGGIPALRWATGDVSLLEFLRSMDRNEPEWLTEARKNQRKRGAGRPRKAQQD